MHKLILKNYENNLLNQLKAKGFEKGESEDALEFIMAHLDALAEVAHGEGETDTTSDEPQWGEIATDTKEKEESYYLPLSVKRMLFNLLYPDGIIGEPTIEDCGKYYRVTAKVYENRESLESDIPLGTYSKEYGDDDLNVYSYHNSKITMQQLLSLARGAVLTRALGFGVGIGYETINCKKTEKTVDDKVGSNENFNSLVATREKKKKTASDKNTVKGAGTDAKTMDDFKSFVAKPEPATETPVENTEKHAEDTSVALTATEGVDFDKKLTSNVQSFNGRSVKELFSDKGYTGLDFFLKQNSHSPEDKAIVKAFLRTLKTTESEDILNRYA